MEKKSVSLVKDALAHLFDYPHLLGHPLIPYLGISTELPSREQMRLLRSRLIEAIEQLRPSSGAALRSTRSRSYQVLYLHYVESLLVDEVARELAVSPRQVYRDLRKAEDDLAIMLGLDDLQRSETKDANWPREVSGASLTGEAALVGDTGGNLVLDTVLTEVAAITESLARSRDIQVKKLASPTMRGQSCCSVALVRQALISLTSLAIKLAEPHTKVLLSARNVDRAIQLSIVFTGEHMVEAEPLATAKKLLALVKGNVVISTEESKCAMTITLPATPKKRIFLIDDNPDLAELCSRFLKDSPYSLTTAQDSAEGLNQVLVQEPDAIILDVMMPGRDGWSLLQRLASDPATKRIPVIVCSVIDDPELAASLGAAAFLPKPVTRSQLLAVLADLLPQPKEP